MPNDFEDHNEDENPNPLAGPVIGEATYEQLEDGKWVGKLNLHVSHQIQARGVTKAECEAKLQVYLEGE